MLSGCAGVKSVSPSFLRNPTWRECRIVCRVGKWLCGGVETVREFAYLNISVSTVWGY